MTAIIATPIGAPAMRLSSSIGVGERTAALAPGHTW
jgi:hypothetical protein